MSRRPPFLVDGNTRLAPRILIKIDGEASADAVADFRRRWDEALETGALLEVYVKLPRRPARLSRFLSRLWRFLT